MFFIYGKFRKKGEDRMTSYIMEKSLADRIDDVLKNIHERNPVRLRNNTPDVLVDNGVIYRCMKIHLT